MPYPPRLQRLLDDLATLDDRLELVEAFVSLGSQLRPFGAPELPADRRVQGCESEAYVFVGVEQDRLKLDFVVLNPQGVTAQTVARVLQMALDGEPPQTAEAVSDDIVAALFGDELSMGKTGGLTNMVRMVRAQASLLAPG